LSVKKYRSLGGILAQLFWFGERQNTYKKDTFSFVSFSLGEQRK
jgi:hypothetical protein